MNLDLDIKQNAGRWNLEKIDLQNPFSGITNNASEALNSKLKRLLEWKEKTGDMVILYLYYWQINAVQENVWILQYWRSKAPKKLQLLGEE